MENKNSLTSSLMYQRSYTTDQGVMRWKMDTHPRISVEVIPWLGSETVTDEWIH